MRLRSLPFAAFVLVACALIFWLPLHVPMAYSGSISYMLGFNNRAALYALLAVLAAGGFALSGHRLDLSPATSRVPGGPSRRAVLMALGVVLAGCLLLTLVASPTWGMDESPYLIGRVRQVLAGARPYVDFEFIYGPALLYLPAWTARLLHIGAGPAYFVVWIAEWLAGTLMAALVVRLLGFQRSRANAAFAVLLSLFAASLFSTGETYTPFRELASLLSLLLVERALRSRFIWLPFVAAMGTAACLFLLSPEMALAFMAACAVYLALAFIAKHATPRRGLYALGYAVMLAVFYALLRGATAAHEFDSARQFGSGGSDVPLILSPTSLWIFGCLLATAAYGARRLRRREFHQPAIAAALTAFVLLPGALGRADPGHLVLYGTGAVLVALALAAERNGRTFRRVAWLTVLLLSVPLLLSKLYNNRLVFYDSAVKRLFPHGVVPASGPAHALDAWVLRRYGPAGELKLRRRFVRNPVDPHDVFSRSSAQLAAPWGYYVSGFADVLPPDLHLGYFDGFNDVMTAPQMQRKIDELRTHPERDLLLPGSWHPQTACLESAQGGVALLRGQNGFTYLRHQRNFPTIVAPVCAYIGEHYRMIVPQPGELSGYALWHRIR